MPLACTFTTSFRKEKGNKNIVSFRDEELKLEEIESSHTLGGYRRGRCYSAVRYTIVNRSHRNCYRKDKGLVSLGENISNPRFEDRRKPCDGSGRVHRWSPIVELLKLQNRGQFPDESVRIKV